jgi:CheY-like chemotaxis protein
VVVTMSDAGTPQDTGRMGPVRLLVVDDDVVDRQAVRRAITRSGLAVTEVREAGSAAQALEMLERAAHDGRVDCMLLDFELGGETGLDVLRTLRGRGDTTPVVVLTGHADPIIAATLMRRARPTSSPRAC